jgi:hypothetical protein
MNATAAALQAKPMAKSNPQWAQLPIFDRSGWETLPFGAFADCISERAQPVEFADAIYVGLEHLDTENLHIRRWGKGSDVEGVKLRFYKGDIIFGRRRAYQRKLAVAEMDGICSAHAMVLRAKPELCLPEFLPFLMMSAAFMKRAVEISVGSLSPTISWGVLKQQPFTLPPDDQQRRIAELLWAVDENATHNDVLIAQLHSARTALLDGLIPSPESDSRVSFVAMKDIATMQNGRPFPSTDYQEDGIRLIRPGNLGINGFLQWPESATVCMPKSYLKDNKDWLVGADQVVINLTAQSLEDGFMGRACITRQGEEGFLNQRIGRFILSDAILPRFFWRCLQTKRFRELVESRCEGSKVRHTYFRHFADFAIPMLNIEAQLQIVDQIDAVDEALEQANINGRAIQDLCRALINGVITGA